MPLLVNKTINVNAVTWLLVVIAVLIGVLVAIEGSGSLLASTANDRSVANQDRISDLATTVADLQRKFSDFKRDNDSFHAEQRRGLVALSEKINEIRLGLAKKGHR